MGAKGERTQNERFESSGKGFGHKSHEERFEAGKKPTTPSHSKEEKSKPSKFGGEQRHGGHNPNRK